MRTRSVRAELEPPPLHPAWGSRANNDDGLTGAVLPSSSEHRSKAAQNVAHVPMGILGYL
jgi:hypothetical protein